MILFGNGLSHFSGDFVFWINMVFLRSLCSLAPVVTGMTYFGIFRYIRLFTSMASRIPLPKHSSGVKFRLFVRYIDWRLFVSNLSSSVLDMFYICQLG